MESNFYCVKPSNRPCIKQCADCARFSPEDFPLQDTPSFPTLREQVLHFYKALFPDSVYDDEYIYDRFIRSQPSLCCDKWTDIEANIRALSMSIDAMRGLDRWGVSEILKRVFTGFKALPEKVEAKPWWEVLQCTARASKDDIKKAYWRLAKIHHPDNGGSPQAFSELSDAYQFGMSQ